MVKKTDVTKKFQNPMVQEEKKGNNKFTLFVRIAALIAIAMFAPEFLTDEKEDDEEKIVPDEKPRKEAAKIDNPLPNIKVEKKKEVVQEKKEETEKEKEEVVVPKVFEEEKEVSLGEVDGDKEIVEEEDIFKKYAQKIETSDDLKVVSSSSFQEQGLFEEIKDLGQEIKKEAEKNIYVKVDYKRLGRGLVYNCRSKFWACLNKKEYLNCRGNLKWSKLNKKKRECVPSEVYASFEDCKIIQLDNVNQVKKTDFCGN